MPELAPICFALMDRSDMMGFLATVSLSMSACRRGQPIPQDFALALAESGIEPSQLRDQLGLRIPDNVSCPEIFPPPPEEAASVDLRQMLGSSLCEATPITHLQIPSHFPPLPSQHTWRDTRQMAQREKDPRKIRERATQEGILAEQSLRKLAAAANKPHSRSNRTSSAIRENKQAIWQDALASVMPDGLQDTQAMDDDSMALDGAADTSRRSTRTPMVINYDRAHWRKGASFGAVRS